MVHPGARAVPQVRQGLVERKLRRMTSIKTFVVYDCNTTNRKTTGSDRNLHGAVSYCMDARVGVRHLMVWISPRNRGGPICPSSA